jgi:rhodanese-related sulfurtransferase
VKIITIGIITVVGVGGILLMSQGQSSGGARQSDNTMSMAAIETDMQTGAKLIDVRTPAEYAAGYVKSAINLPLGDIQSGTTPDTPKDTKLYVYCKSGNRSVQAKKYLEKAGFTNVVDLGGINEVLALGGKQVR